MLPRLCLDGKKIWENVRWTTFFVLKFCGTASFPSFLACTYFFAKIKAFVLTTWFLKRVYTFTVFLYQNFHLNHPVVSSLVVLYYPGKSGWLGKSYSSHILIEILKINLNIELSSCTFSTKFTKIYNIYI